MSLAPSSKVTIIGPKFGTASQAIDKTVRNHMGDENVHALWYEESRFERRTGRFVGRLIRVALQVLPLPPKVRSRAERFIGAIRFRRRDSIAEQMAWAGLIGPADHLLLVKPMFLRPDDLVALRRSVGAATVTIVLWDALWRTPSVSELIDGESVFSTEPTDCKMHGFNFLPVPPLELHQDLELKAGSNALTTGGILPTPETSNLDRPIRMFFCGSWSFDRWLEARRLMTAVRSLENDVSKYEVGESHSPHFICELHLVTANKLAAWLTASAQALSTPLSAVRYEEGVARCDVLLDLGRTGQSSPSERLDTAVRNGKILASTNPHLEHLGFPVVPIKRHGWVEALEICELALRTKTPIPQSWDTNATASAFVITPEDWANTVFRSPENQAASPSKNDGPETCERPFSFVHTVPKISERIPA